MLCNLDVWGEGDGDEDKDEGEDRDEEETIGERTYPRSNTTDQTQTITSGKVTTKTRTV